MRYSKSLRMISLLLASLIFVQSLVPAKALAVEPVTEIYVSADNSESDAADETVPWTETSPAGTESVVPDETQALEEETVSVYEDGSILIYSYDQLLLIGSGQAVHSADAESVGSGELVLSEVGTAVIYSLQAVYRIARDIVLPKGAVWQLPAGFAGRITPVETGDERELYDADADTIYVYNPYQLAVMAMDNAAEQPVMSNDMDAETVGMGQLIILDDGSYLTYGPEHNYVISSRFDATIPEHSYATSAVNENDTAAPLADEAAETEPATESADTGIATIAETGLGGQEFAGQVLKTVNGMQYIMLGNEAQLRVIGTDTEVYTRAYDTKYNVNGKYYARYDDDGNPVMLYGGDADYQIEHNGLIDTEFHVTKDQEGTYRTGVYQDGDNKGTIIEGYAATVSGAFKTGVEYASDAHYIIFRDIELTKGKWNLPMDFTGEIVPAETPTTRELYNQSTDTLYIHNRPQLEAMYSADAASTVVHANDAYVDQFGTGDVVKKADGTDLTYGDVQTYVLSKYFSSAMPANTSLDRWGRDFPGQVLKTIDGEQYILIGNAEQLRAIGTDTEVYRAVYQWVSGGVDTRKDNGAYILRYGGDADLLQSQNGYADFTFHTVNAADSSISNKSGTRSKAGVDQETGEIDPDLGEGTGVKYSSTANYIIFRDIDLNNEAWTPLMFSGTMLGVESPADYTMLWDAKGNSAKTITVTARPTISNVKVEQSAAIEVTQFMGIGFFATISNEYDTANIGIVGDQAEVRNLELHNVSVSTTTSKTNVDQTIVSGLLSLVGGLLGGVLDGLIWLITIGNVTLNLSTMLSDLLNARAKDPTALATGAFAGRIVGNVLVDNCDVTGTVEVHNINNYTGGFVGYVEGATEYDGLSKTLGGVVDVLSSLLNIIPGLGLGDLITILLGNVIDVKTLIPTGYVEPKITNCELNGLTGIVGNANGDAKDYIGGFVGQETGALMVNNTISDSNYTVRANSYGGGFAGVARDAEVEGTLGLDDLVNVDAGDLPNFQTQSLLMECDIHNSNVRVEGTQNLGGFVGVLANSYAINNTMTGGTLVVQGKNADASTPAVNVGGFAGRATLGWGASIGGETSKDSTLLGTVSELLTGLLGDKETAVDQQLLSLAGVAPSAILGFEMDFDTIDVLAESSYVGGVVGRGDGLIIGKSDDEYVSELSFWKYGDAAALTSEQKRSVCKVEGLRNVSSGGDYAGGVAGFMGTASAGGLLDSTLGLARFIGFTVDGVSVTGVDAGYTVSADGVSAGGGFGAVVGGMIDNVNLNKLRSVAAMNRAGGFIGLAGPGDLASDGGLQISLLGLNVLEINNLLAVGQGIEVEITDSNVIGIADGFTVEAKGKRSSNDDISEFAAAGFLAESHSTEVQRCAVSNLKQVTASDLGGYAGGFLGTSEVGGLAEVADDEKLLDLIKADGLVNAVSYLIPKYISCTVSYVDGGGVQADVAGGFVADLQSGSVDNSALSDPYSVYNLDHVDGQTYAGGFGGIVQSGALADAGKGISILGDLELVDISIDVSDLLSLVNTYVPFVECAGVYSKNGFTVQAEEIRDIDSRSGSAGGFVGFASGAQISYSDVNGLKHTTVIAPEELEAVQAPTYFDASSAYAVSGGRYAGGFFGNMDIGSAASLGGGLKILGSAIQLTNILDALSVVVTTVEHSNVYGAAGGFSVKADGIESVKREIELGDGTLGPVTREEIVGMAGGFAGNISGGHVQDCNVYNFYYIIGQVAAGGYVGNLQPGNVASVLNDTSILSGLVELPTELLSLAEDFVPTIRNSSTDAVPCGGAVRAHAPSDQFVQRGMAGGYVGHNEGGNIWGNNTAAWKDENDEIRNDLGIVVERIYNGTISPCEAIRIRSVYGYEYAGGFTGLMEPADTAQSGGLSLLGGLIKVGNLLGALSVVYPTEENTAVYGPLAKLDYITWNKWVDYVGKFGGYGVSLADNGKFETQEALDAVLDKYIYGYNVVAGRSAHETLLYSEGGDAGGYVGLMESGTITNAHAYDVRIVKAMRNAGGFAGRMVTGGAASFGNVNILGLELNIGELLSVAEVFVPVVKDSSVCGYQSGLTVHATGTDHVHKCGYAGGYAGSVYGAQIWGDGEGCNVENLRRVKGTNAIGGYVGLATAATVASANTNASSGLLQGILDFVIGSPGDLLSVLDATVTTIRGASVSAVDDWGFEVDGKYGSNKYANYAGGFAGALEAAILSEEIEDNEIPDYHYQLNVTGLRSVDGGLYAGGFFGLADVTSVATVSGTGEENKTSVLLGLIQVGRTDVLSAFRTYIYNATVTGIEEGYWVYAHESDVEGILDSTRYMGCAGGFGGGLMNGSVKDSAVSNLSTVEGLNYVGGFIGHMGKNGVVDLDDVSVLGLLNPSVGLLDVFGSHVDDCTLTGIADGYVIKAQGGAESVAGGFVGYADVSRINDCTATNLKKVVSDQIAGGFIGMTNRSYLVDVDADSPLLAVILWIVNALIDHVIQLDELENGGIIDLEIPGTLLGMENAFELNVLADGNLLYVNLLGIRIGVSLSSENGQDRLHIHIGDSEINLNYVEGKDITNEDLADAQIKLFKGNRTEVNDCSVTGISVGYDVLGGGAADAADGTHQNGHSGGFVGLNREGQFKRNNMYLCDTVRGTAGQVGPFSGTIDLKTVYDNYTIDDLEAEGWNTYRVYRKNNPSYPYALKVDGTAINDPETAEQVTIEAVTYDRYDVKHLASIRKFSDLKDAVMATAPVGGSTMALGAYVSDAMAVLMLNTPVRDNAESLSPEPAEMLDPCADTVALTIQKVWDDYDNALHLRPDSITVTVWQSYTKNGETEKSEYRTVTLTANTDWRTEVKGLPVALIEKNAVTGEETLYYYTYTVTEDRVENYKEPVVNSDGRMVTITNILKPVGELPFTGGIGDMAFVGIGVGLILLGTAKQKPRRRGKYKGRGDSSY